MPGVGLGSGSSCLVRWRHSLANQWSQLTQALSAIYLGNSQIEVRSTGHWTVCCIEHGGLSSASSSCLGGETVPHIGLKYTCILQRLYSYMRFPSLRKKILKRCQGKRGKRAFSSVWTGQHIRMVSDFRTL